MPYINSPTDGASLFYADYHPAHNSKQPTTASTTSAATRNLPKISTLVFLHGWPMSHEMYTHVMLPLTQTHRIRCIAPDRRGFGKSAWSGVEATSESCKVTYDTFAEDTIAVVRAANITGNWAFVAASMGAGESLLVLHLLKHHVQKEMRELAGRCKGYLWLGPSLPFPVQCDANPTAPAQEVWDSIVAGLREDRVGFARVALPGVFGTREVMGLGLELAPTKLEFFEHIVRQADALAIERCVGIITGRDFTEEVRRVDRRVLVLHGDGDQGMPASASADMIKTIAPKGLCEVKIYRNAAHGLYLTHAEQVVQDVLEFIVSVS